MVDNNLKHYVDDFFKDLELYDDYKNDHDYKSILTAAIDVFLEYESNYTAFEVYQTFLMIYQIIPEDKSEEKKIVSDIVSEQNTLLDLTNIMKDYEEKTEDLVERQRDHFIHSVNVFLLGLAVYSQNKNYRRIFKNYIIKSDYEKYYKTAEGEFSDEEFLYRWGVASLFHDIGYPFEIIAKQLNKFIKDSVNSISSSYDVDVGIDFKDFNEFNSIVRVYPYHFADNYRGRYEKSKIIDLFKPTEIMAHKIAHNFNFDKERYRYLLNHLNRFILKMKTENFIDHGFFSAILVLNSYGSLMQKHAKDFDFFFYPIVDSATAILLHNYYNKTLQKDPYFYNPRYPGSDPDPEKAKEKGLGPLFVHSYPIAYLLILCDELQEWNRQPFGTLDKQKSHVNDLNIVIDDRKMEVEYVLNSGSMGLGFEDEKEGFIYSVLDIKSTVFPGGLSVSIDADSKIEKEVMRNMDMEDIQAPDLLFRNIEELAREIHRQFCETSIRDSQRNETLPEFDKLSPDLKLSNIRQARSIPRKLSMIGCEIVNKSDERPAISTFDGKEIEDLAILEHKEWCKEKEGFGWTYSEEKDEVNHKTPYLVEWDELDDETKQYDIDAIKNIPHLLDSIGLKIVRSKIRLLTFEMHKYYMKDKQGLVDTTVSSEELFNKLPYFIQFSNYKQANFIVKILKERGYDIVDINDDGVAVDAFNDIDLEYFAKREHKNWYSLKVNLGWKYGNGEEPRTSPNLVPWSKVEEDIKEDNKRTFQNLPKMCNEEHIQLKIVKSE